MALAPQLEELHRSTAALQVIAISRGDVEENRRKAAEQGLTFPVALQKRYEISRAYGILATPVAYWIDEDGVLAADVAVGSRAILKLAAQAHARGEQQSALAAQ
jgi:peroxiredoxin